MFYLIEQIAQGLVFIASNQKVYSYIFVMFLKVDISFRDYIVLSIYLYQNMIQGIK